MQAPVMQNRLAILKPVFEQARDAIFIIDPEKGRIVEANPAAERLLGFSRDELLCMDMFDLHPSDADRLQTFFCEVMQQGHGANDGLMCLMKNGEFIDADITASVIDVDGATRVVSFVRDITERKQEERKMAALAQYPENNPSPVIRFDRQGWVLDCNAAARKLYDRDVGGETISKLFPFIDDVDSHHLIDTDQLIEKQGTVGVHTFVLRLRGVRTLDCGYIYASDVSELEAGKSKLVEAEADLRAMQAAVPLPLMVTRRDDGRIVHANMQMARLFGKTLADVDGEALCAVDFFPDPNVREDIQRELDKKGAVTERSLTLHAADDRTIHVLASMRRFRYEGELATLTVLHDVTQKRQVEMQFEQLLDMLPDAILVHQDGRIAYANPEALALSGCSEAEFIGEPFIQYVHPDCRQTLMENVAILLAGGMPDQPVREYTLLKHNGTAFCAEIRSVRVEYAGRPAIQVVVRDMTAQRELEEQLRQAQKMEALGTLVGGIAHDFNNLLGGILGNAFLIRRRCDLDASGQEKIERIEAACATAADTIRQLLTFARKGQAEKHVFSLTPLLKETCKLAQTGLPESIHFCMQCEAGEAVIEGDAAQLKQVMINLIANAMHAVGDVEDAKVTVSFKLCNVNTAMRSRHPDMQRGGHAKLTVRDNGCGIVPENIQRIFEPFFTTKPSGEGTGLGLAMAYGTVQAHGGAIEVESHPGVGTAFHVWLPLHDSVAETVPVREEIVEGKGQCILIVDDEESVRYATSELIESLGYRVLLAENGQQAVDVFKQHQEDIDLVLMDVVMPEMGGHEAVKAMRKIRAVLPVIFSTGYDRHDVLCDLDLPVCDVVHKPVAVDVLSQTIHKLLNSTEKT